ncbi:ABC transporter substrate-binding protein [Amycolatopsis jejuensis]|uniref:ABC transporter substrate-binding protein n=1 Tax=Amycolatopsis jejuensis TaxID=330084 RepID=UPI000526832A|nr:ABC transporter substrate-binding protein [Amycolatopsis jejuensis]
MVRTTRIAVALAATALLASAVACGSGTQQSSSGGAPKLTVALITGSSWRVPVEIGIAQGYFRQAGVEVELITQPSGTTSGQLLLSNTAQYSASPVANMAQAIQHGQHLSYGCGAQVVTPSALVVPKGSSLPTTAKGADWKAIAKSLEGKKLGLPVPLGTSLQFQLDQAIRVGGADPGKITYVTTGSGATLTGALSGKAIDVAMAFSPDAEALTRGPKSVAEEMIYLPKDGPEMYRDYAGGYTASQDWLKQNPETAAKFCQGIRDSIKWLHDGANQQAYTQVLTKVAGNLDPGALETVESRLTAAYSADIPRDLLEAALKRAYSYPGLLKPEPVVTYQDLVTMPAPKS